MVLVHHVCLTLSQGPLRGKAGGQGVALELPLFSLVYVFIFVPGSYLVSSCFLSVGAAAVEVQVVE